MRLSKSTSKTLCIYRKDTKNGGSQIVSYPDSVDSQVTSRFDITKVIADASGWREPTRYGSSVSRSVPWIGNVWWKDDYDAYGGGTDYIKQTFDGTVENIPSISFPNHKPLPLTHPTVTVPPVYSRALNKALANLKDQQVQYATFLAEAGEASSMLLTNAKKIAAAYKFVRKGQFKRAANELRISPGSFRSHRRPRNQDEVSARWLEAQYGWLPLMSDMYGIYEDVRKGFFREPRISAKGMATDEGSRSIKLNQQLYTGTSSFTSTHSCFVRLDYVLDSEKLQRAVQKGLTNPLEVAWELVPFSFIVDWFTPIGDFLSSLDADFGVTFKAGTYTTYYKFESKGDMTPKPWTSGSGHRYSQGGSIHSYKYNLDIMREKFSSSPTGELYFKNPLSLLHVANALALIHQIFLKGK